jgi:iron complex transport system ATP-binding protein
MGVDVSERDLRLTGRIIEIIGLTDSSRKLVNEISGGEYQLVQIARALAQQPKVLIMDEPTSNLDLSNQGRVMKAVSDIVRDNGMCAVMVNHDINLALRYSNRFIMMSGGRIFAAGGKEIITPENIRAVYGIDADVCEFNGKSIVIPK